MFAFLLFKNAFICKPLLRSDVTFSPRSEITFDFCHHLIYFQPLIISKEGMKVDATKGEVFFNDLLTGSKASIRLDVMSRLTGGHVKLRSRLNSVPWPEASALWPSPQTARDNQTFRLCDFQTRQERWGVRWEGVGGQIS